MCTLRFPPPAQTHTHTHCKYTTCVQRQKYTHTHTHSPVLTHAFILIIKNTMVLWLCIVFDRTQNIAAKVYFTNVPQKYALHKSDTHATTTTTTHDMLGAFPLCLCASTRSEYGMCIGWLHTSSHLGVSAHAKAV